MSNFLKLIDLERSLAIEGPSLTEFAIEQRLQRAGRVAQRQAEKERFEAEERRLTAKGNIEFEKAATDEKRLNAERERAATAERRLLAEKS